jgi:hypothetical protein
VQDVVVKAKGLSRNRRNRFGVCQEYQESIRSYLMFSVQLNRPRIFVCWFLCILTAKKFGSQDTDETVKVSFRFYLIIIIAHRDR